jgi:hypothetical protein
VFFPIHASILAFGVADDTKRSSALEFGHFEAPIGEPNCKLATRKKPPLRRIPLPHFYEERVSRPSGGSFILMDCQRRKLENRTATQ